MDAFLVSTGIVGLAEIGDKTQLLALLLATRLRRPLPIVLGILVATLLNHAFSAAAGVLVGELLGPVAVRWLLGLSFLGIAIWTVLQNLPHAGEREEPPLGRHGVFLATALAFFIAEMGDKTQVATVALAARYEPMAAVVAGTTLGMMLANVPLVYAGGRIAGRAALAIAHGIAALVFAAAGIATLLGAGGLAGA
ncbi:TMEM165/GDT1 family protein [Massilia sp. MS-15]|uniref:TMEM165/GDT1 family protein n=1 Tax=Massilia sp. MS-15 TaxID=2878200 RepID=UPI001CD37286|nr:TMEM165/GDT1 family protein [Massilia sp. MS-15]MCA1245652.1 TMEM165/GDT1 family protein [Massilia sp. MS-15]